MTNMEHALRQAGVKLPLMHRAWLMVKDHPGTTSPRIAQLLKAKEADVSSTMSQLRRRKMVDFKMETVKGRMGIGMGTREVYTYSVPARMKEYELLPRSHKPRSKPRKVADEAVVEEKPVPVTYYTPVPVAAPAPPPVVEAALPSPVVSRVPTRSEIDAWPLADARRVYDYLCDYFTP